MDEEIQLQTTDSKIESIADNRYKERQTYRQQMDIDEQQTIENDGDEKVDQHEEATLYKNIEFGIECHLKLLNFLN